MMANHYHLNLGFEYPDVQQAFFSYPAFLTIVILLLDFLSQVFGVFFDSHWKLGDGIEHWVIQSHLRGAEIKKINNGPSEKEI